MRSRLLLLPLPAVALSAVALACPSPDAPPAEPASTGQAAPAPAFDHTHAAWTAVLAKHVEGDLFDYAALKQDRAGLDAYLAQLQAVTPAQERSWTKEQRFAFWINVYNAFTIHKVVESYPLDSIKDLNTGLLGINSVFDKDFIPLAAHDPEGENEPLSLNDVEHGILRARFADARVHAAINCASASCPPLRDEAFVADRLEEQLDAQMTAFVNDPKRNVFDVEKGRLRLSKIFDWFEKDFERDAGSVREYVARYAPEERRAFVRSAKITHLDYDWSLNEVPSER